MIAPTLFRILGAPIIFLSIVVVCVCMEERGRGKERTEKRKGIFPSFKDILRAQNRENIF